VQEVFAQISFNQTKVSHNLENFFMVAEQPEVCSVQLSTQCVDNLLFQKYLRKMGPMLKVLGEFAFLPDLSSRASSTWN